MHFVCARCDTLPSILRCYNRSGIRLLQVTPGPNNSAMRPGHRFVDTRNKTKIVTLNHSMGKAIENVLEEFDLAGSLLRGKDCKP